MEKEPGAGVRPAFIVAGMALLTGIAGASIAGHMIEAGPLSQVASNATDEAEATPGPEAPATPPDASAPPTATHTASPAALPKDPTQPSGDAWTTAIDPRVLSSPTPTDRPAPMLPLAAPATPLAGPAPPGGPPLILDGLPVPTLDPPVGPVQPSLASIL